MAKPFQSQVWLVQALLVAGVVTATVPLTRIVLEWRSSSSDQGRQTRKTILYGAMAKIWSQHFLEATKASQQTPPAQAPASMDALLVADKAQDKSAREAADLIAAVQEEKDAANAIRAMLGLGGMVSLVLAVLLSTYQLRKARQRIDQANLPGGMR